MAEDYVRPPVLAAEPPSRTASLWRFRLVMALLVIAVGAAIAFALHAILGGGEGGTTVGLSRLVAGVARL